MPGDGDSLASDYLSDPSPPPEEVAMPKPNSRPAFPFPNDDLGIQGLKSISLRDWFAGMALHDSIEQGGYSWSIKEVAKRAYEVADAMLKEREEP